MYTKLFVISDLHLGGKPGFQICPERNQRQLAKFLENLPSPSRNSRVHLVLAGDIVDFLSEEEFRAFTSDEDEARLKLLSVVAGTRPVWDALRGFVTEGGELTLLLGNHDVELSLPEVRRTLLDLLQPMRGSSVGGGRVDFVYDNEVFSLGPVIVEHGNRYDEWNAVAHGALRRLRSRLSRRLPPGSFPAMPGSQLVVEVMNRLKHDYSWVDLLKPETAGVLPILAALGAGSLTDVWKAFQKYRMSREIAFDDDREPVDDTYMGAPDESSALEASDQAMYDLAQDIAAGGDASEISAFELLTGARDTVGSAVREARRNGLTKALRAFANHHRRTFDVGVESAVYSTPARAAADRGFQVIIYGHTHLAKKVQLDGSRGEALYLNTGTWADLIRIPDAVFGDDSDSARLVLDGFVTDLERDEVSKWRRAAPTYALVELDGDEVVAADVHFQDEKGTEAVTTKGLLARLDGEALHG